MGISTLNIYRKYTNKNVIHYLFTDKYINFEIKQKDMDKIKSGTKNAEILKTLTKEYIEEFKAIGKEKGITVDPPQILVSGFVIGVAKAIKYFEDGR